MTKEISETINFIWVVAKNRRQKQKQKLLMKLLVYSRFPSSKLAHWVAEMRSVEQGRRGGKPRGRTGCHKRL